MSDPDFIGALLEALRHELQVPAAGGVIEPRPAQWLQLERAGGAGGITTDAPLLSISAWADSKGDAYDLAQAARLYLLRRLPPVVGGYRVLSRSEAAGPAYEPHPVSGQERYRWTIEVRHHHHERS